MYICRDYYKLRYQNKILELLLPIIIYLLAIVLRIHLQYILNYNKILSPAL